MSIQQNLARCFKNLQKLENITVTLIEDHIDKWEVNYMYPNNKEVTLRFDFHLKESLPPKITVVFPASIQYVCFQELGTVEWNKNNNDILTLIYTLQTEFNYRAQTRTEGRVQTAEEAQSQWKFVQGAHSDWGYVDVVELSKKLQTDELDNLRVEGLTVLKEELNGEYQPSARPAVSKIPPPPPPPAFKKAVRQEVEKPVVLQFHGDEEELPIQLFWGEEEEVADIPLVVPQGNPKPVEDPNELPFMLFWDEEPKMHFVDPEPAVLVEKRELAVALKDQEDDELPFMLFWDPEPALLLEKREPALVLKNEEDDEDIKLLNLFWDAEPAVPLEKRDPAVLPINKEAAVVLKDQEDDELPFMLFWDEESPVLPENPVVLPQYKEAAVVLEDQEEYELPISLFWDEEPPVLPENKEPAVVLKDLDQPFLLNHDLPVLDDDDNIPNQFFCALELPVLPENQVPVVLEDKELVVLPENQEPVVLACPEKVEMMSEKKENLEKKMEPVQENREDELQENKEEIITN